MQRLTEACGSMQPSSQTVACTPIFPHRLRTVLEGKGWSQNNLAHRSEGSVGHVSMVYEACGIRPLPLQRSSRGPWAYRWIGWWG